ncbi:lysoplasmalogenase family protein [Anaerolentibacter hominis]|uniref:lysoplasmalogenase family protein n=1 Tax=Anaerolentibacter hominis TaxID=3079009 RepID=UPI0031B7F654
MVRHPEWRFRLFILAEACLYLVFVSGDVFGWLSAGVTARFKYIGILLCVFFLISNDSRIRSFPLALGLLLTAIADWFLLFTEAALPGVLLFCLIQFCYQAELGGKRGITIMLPAGLITGVTAAACAGRHGGSLLLGAAGFYAGIEVFNIVSAVIKAVPLQKKQQLYLPAGLILLFICDLFVGIYNLPRFLPGTFSGTFHATAGNLIWVCYLPSQLLICSAALGK